MSLIEYKKTKERIKEFSVLRKSSNNSVDTGKSNPNFFD